MYQKASREILNHNLAKRYAELDDAVFTKKSFKKDCDCFLNHYPVILSTTFSIINSILKGFLFDYLIINESSQIVGDTKQLPQIVDEKLKDKLVTECPAPSYDYFCHSLLSSMIEVLGEKAPRKLPREHYRLSRRSFNFAKNAIMAETSLFLKKALSRPRLSYTKRLPEIT